MATKPQSLNKFKALPYRKGVGAVIFNNYGLVWLGRRISDPTNKITKYWQMPQGGIDNNETPEIAVLREVKEETGTGRVEIIDQVNSWIEYDLPEDLMGVAWNGKFRGQKQLWFALRFTGNDSDFNLTAAQNPEFLEWRWAGLLSLPELIVPFKRNLYIQIVSEFKLWPEKIKEQYRSYNDMTL